MFPFSSQRHFPSSRGQAARNRKFKSRKPTLEMLEDRTVPSVSYAWGDLTSYAELTNDPDSTYKEDYANDLAVDQAGNRYVLGSTFDRNDTSTKIFHVEKFNTDNSLAWISSFHGPDYIKGGAVTVDPSGNVYAALPTWVNGNPGPVDILKLDAFGIEQQRYRETRATADWWDGNRSIELATDSAEFVYYTAPGYTVKLQSQPANLVPVDEYEFGGFALAVSPAGDRVYVTGRFSGTAVDFDPTHSYADNRDILATTRRARDTSYDVFILELNANANTGDLEFKWVGQIASPGWNIADDIAFDTSGVYVLGAGVSTETDFDPGPGQYTLSSCEGMFLLKLDSQNQFEWVKGLGGNGEYPDSDDGRGRLALDEQGSVYVFDVFYGELGDFDNEHTFPGDIDQMAGAPRTNTFFLAKYSEQGVFRWVATAKGTIGAKLANGLALTAEGIHVLATSFNDTITVNPGGAQFTATSVDMLQLTFTQTADPVMVYVKNVSQAEGNSGTTTLFTFQVFLSDPVNYAVTVHYSTADGTAVAGSDYTATSGSITFAPGQTEATITISVIGDGTSEGDETFNLDLWSEDLSIEMLRSLVTIIDDDLSGGKGKKK